MEKLNKTTFDMGTNLSSQYIAGFVDGEGCFGFQFRKDVRHERPGAPVYYSWKAQFMITARKDERDLFERIKKHFGCGNIYKAIDREIHFCVSNINDLHNIISPFFKKYQLQGKKKNDFILWAEAVDIMNRNKKKGANAQKDLQRLLEIHSAMQKYKSERPQGLRHINVARHQFHSDPDKK